MRPKSLQEHDGAPAMAVLLAALECMLNTNAFQRYVHLNGGNGARYIGSRAKICFDQVVLFCNVVGQTLVKQTGWSNTQLHHASFCIEFVYVIVVIL